MGKIYLNSIEYAGVSGPGETFTIQGTLLAGATSITFTDTRIETDSRIFPWCSIWGVVPTAVSISTGSVTLTFAAQQSDMDVEVDVSGAYAYAEGESF